MHTITIICGLIGAGKSTWAARHFETFTDLDAVPGWQKADQIRKTLDLVESGHDVAHITCYPTQDEEVAFRDMPVVYVWVDTPPAVCKKNILKRGRLRDIQNLASVEAANDRLYDRLISSRLPFRRVSVFESNERW